MLFCSVVRLWNVGAFVQVSTFHVLKDSLHDLSSSCHVLAYDLGTEGQSTAPLLGPSYRFVSVVKSLRRLTLTVITSVRDKKITDVLYSGFFLSFFFLLRVKVRCLIYTV